jgi:ABC-type methionine transport system ATPase subunit
VASRRVSLLSLSGVRKRYGEPSRDIEVLRGLDFEIYRGEFVGIWGDGGAGRTTLTRIVAGLEAPTAGTVSYAGEDLACLTLEDRVRLWRTGVTWLGGAGPADEEATVCEYVAEPLLGHEERAQAHEHASRVLTDWELGDVVDERWADLEEDLDRVMAEIVRTLMRPSALLVLDDLTARVHFDECEYVMNVLRSLAEEKFLGVLLTTRRMSDLLHVHRFAWLSDGRLIEPHPGGPIAERSRRVPFDGRGDLEEEGDQGDEEDLNL